MNGIINHAEPLLKEIPNTGTPSKEWGELKGDYLL